MLIPKERVEAVAAAWVQAGMPYDESIRGLLLQGLPPAFVAMLRGAAMPAIQLRLDLNRLNEVERLADGTIPLEVWLGNALPLVSHLLQASVLREVLGEVTQHATGAPRIPAARASVPAVPEKIVGRDDTLPVGFLQGGARIAVSVARLVVTRYEAGTVKRHPSGDPFQYLGTGWLIAPRLLITNHHVVNARNDREPRASAIDLALQATATVAEFDFDSPNSLKMEVGVVALEAADAELDYALLRVPAPALAARPSLPLNRKRLQVSGVLDYVAVNIIQHPGGRSKQVALRNNLVYQTVGDVVHYFTDTQGGSSGSPVCDDQWQVVALHRAAVPVANVQFQGQSEGWVNQGTQITAILAHLQLHHPDLYAEIVSNA